MSVSGEEILMVGEKLQRGKGTGVEREDGRAIECRKLLQLAAKN